MTIRETLAGIEFVNELDDKMIPLVGAAYDNSSMTFCIFVYCHLTPLAFLHGVETGSKLAVSVSLALIIVYAYPKILINISKYPVDVQCADFLGTGADGQASFIGCYGMNLNPKLKSKMVAAYRTRPSRMI